MTMSMIPVVISKCVTVNVVMWMRVVPDHIPHLPADTDLPPTRVYDRLIGEK